MDAGGGDEQVQVRRRSPLMGALKSATEEDPDEIIDVVVELNTKYPGGVEAARANFISLWRSHVRARPMTEYEDLDPVQVSTYLYKVALRRAALNTLMQADRANETSSPPTIFRVWPDYPLYPLVDRSVKTVKADAAWRSFDAMGRRIVWAVIDSGIQADHKHFAALELAKERAGTADGTAAAVQGGAAT